MLHRGDLVNPNCQSQYHSPVAWLCSRSTNEAHGDRHRIGAEGTQNEAMTHPASRYRHPDGDPYDRTCEITQAKDTYTVKFEF